MMRPIVVVGCVAAIAAIAAGAGMRRLPAIVQAGDFRVQLVDARDGRPQHVELSDLNPAVLRAIVARRPDQGRWSQAFRVSTRMAAGADGAPAVAGSYLVEGSTVRFVPAFGLSPGIDLNVTIDRAALQRLAGARVAVDAEPLRTRLSVPAVLPSVRTAVVSVYPTSSVLPMNQLKFYIYFSAPMRPGGAATHVRLLDRRSGRPISDPFLEIGEELWDGARQRLTVLLDPGRIKRGVRSNVTMGVPLEAGEDYALDVLASWVDANGAPLASGLQKRFSARGVDRRSPRPGDWRVMPPRRGTRDPLIVRFDEPMDHAIAQRALAVVDSSDRAVRGSVSLSASESVWRFEPAAGWQSGPYRLQIDSRLEDLAGNSLARTFDVDLRRPVDQQAAEDAFFERRFMAREPAFFLTAKGANKVQSER